MALALVLAAGRGERLGSELPKALVALGGRPLVAWSVDALRAVARVREIVVALPDGMASASPEGVDADVVVAGGATRSHSARAALAGGRGDPVIVHDAARPLAAPELFEAVLDELALTGADAVVAAAPVTDTIKRTGADRRVEATLARERLWAVQTPQAFRRAALEEALGQPDDVLARATDDAWLVERLGGSVRVVPAPARNLKVTTALDLALAELLVARH